MDRFNPTPKPYALHVESLESRDVPSGVLVDVPPSTAADHLLASTRDRYAVAAAGEPSSINIHDAQTNAIIGIVTPFGPTFMGQLHVAMGDLNGDGRDDLVVTRGSGYDSIVKVFDGVTLEQTQLFQAYEAGFLGGVNLAVGDVTGDGRADIITGAGYTGGPHVQMFDGSKLYPTGNVSAAIVPTPSYGFYAFESSFRGGATVTTGDIDGDGTDDIIAGAGQGGAPRVQAFHGSDMAVLANFYAGDAANRDGINVAAGHFANTLSTQIAVAPMNGNSIRIYENSQLNKEMRTFAHTVGSIASHDVNDDGIDELIVGVGAGNAPRISVIDVSLDETIRGFPGFTPDRTDGVFVG